MQNINVDLEYVKLNENRTHEVIYHDFGAAFDKNTTWEEFQKSSEELQALYRENGDLVTVWGPHDNINGESAARNFAIKQSHESQEYYNAFEGEVFTVGTVDTQFITKEDFDAFMNERYESTDYMAALDACEESSSSAEEERTR